MKCIPRFTYKSLIPYIFLAFITALLINNIFYGFSWTDEGLYLSNVHRLFTGDKLLIDDWTPTQFYEPLILPLYSLFVKLNGGTEGIFLFFRIVTILFQASVSFFAYSVLSKKYDKVSSLFASFIPLIFSRACLNGPSYYTIGFETYLLGLLCIFAVVELHYKKIFLFLAGIFFACAVLCNPFLVLPYIAISALCLFLKKTRSNLKSVSLIWLGTVVTGIAYLIFAFAGNTLHDILTGFFYTYNDPSYKHTAILTIKRLYKMPRLLVFPYILTWLPMIIVTGAIKIKKVSPSQKIRLILYGLNTFVFLANCFYNKDCGTAVMTFLHFTIFEILISSNGRASLKELFRENLSEILYFILPGMILAYFFCFASDTGFGVCAIGMAIAAIGEIFIYTKYCEKKAFRYIPLFILFAFTFFYRTNVIYRDMQLPPHLLFVPNKNVDRIERGSAKGLYTSMENRKYYDDLYNLLNELNNTTEKKSIFISGVATWTYLSFENLYCAAPSTWRIFFNDMRLQPYYEEFPKYKFPDYTLVLNKDNPSNDKGRPDDISETWMYKELEKRGYTTKDVKNGTLFTRKGEN